MPSQTIANSILEPVGIVFVLLLLALFRALGSIICYAVKIWFTTKIVKNAWKGK